jgi:hypothetical protein
MIPEKWPACWTSVVIPVVLLILTASLVHLPGTAAAEGPVPDHLVIDLPEGVSPDRVPVGGHIDIYALVYDADGKDITFDAEAEWWISPDIASWRYISNVGMRLFPEGVGNLTIHTRAWVGGVNVTGSLNVTLVITVESVVIHRLPETGHVYPGDVLDIHIELLDWKGNTIHSDASFDWSVNSGTVERKVDPAYIRWTAGPTGLAVISVEYALFEQTGSASLTIDVLSRLSSIVIDDMPEKMYSGVYFEFHVRVLDDQGRDVTTEATVRPAVWIDGCMTAIDWLWNSSSGYMALRSKDFGDATINVRAELNDINLTEEVDVLIRMGPPPPEPGETSSPFLEIDGGYMLLLIGTVILVVGLVFWRRSRSSELRLHRMAVKKKRSEPWRDDTDEDDDEEDDEEGMSLLDSMLLEPPE